MPMIQTYQVSVTVECEVSGGGETPADFIAPVADAVRAALRPNQLDTRYGNLTIRGAVLTDVSASRR